MQQNKEWLFFDIGSTLVDESEAYRQRILAMIKGTDIPYDEFSQTMIGYYGKSGKGDKLAAAHYGLTIPEWQSRYEKLFPETADCLRQLSRSFKLGIIANQLPGTVSRLHSFGIGDYFSVVVASAEEGVAKPDPKIFLLALERAGCSPEKAVMIGDRLDNDIAPANRLDFTTIRVMQGYGQYSSPMSADEVPDLTVSSLNELSGIFL